MSNAYLASMKPHIPTPVTAVVAYFSHALRYLPSSPTRRSSDLGAVNFCVTTGNNLGTIGLAAGNGGWGVTITNNNLTTPLVKCAIFINTAVLAPAVTEGAPACQ